MSWKSFVVCVMRIYQWVKLVPGGVSVVCDCHRDSGGTSVF